MALKHLKQLLDEDQEPFVLKNYIDERRCQLKRPVPKTQLQLKRRKPISENSSFFCKNACLFSFHDSPDVKMSPLFSPVNKSPCRNSNTLFVHIPSKTAAILLEAALRIQKQSASKKPKNPKNMGLGFFGSMLKRITHRKKKNISGDEIKVSVKDILRWDSSNGRKGVAEDIMREKEELTMDLIETRVSEVGFSCSCNSRVSSAWSESNEEKSMDLETSSSRSEDSEETIDFVHEQIKTGDFSSYEKEFCSSPFRFVLQNCSSPTGEITPEFMSPVTSPSRLKKQVVKNDEGQLNCVGKELEVEEEEKEQFSPVSVLDPLFEEEDDDEDEEEDEEEEKDGFELERSFANVQRARQQLLHKLRRFERLADLDPIELEKRIAEEEEESEESEDVEEEQYDDDDYEDEDEVSSDNYKGDSFIREVLSVSNSCCVDERISSDMKRLILDLMAEEEAAEEECESSSHDRGTMMMKKLSKRLDSWKEVESNTIDMMVELDFRSEGDLWRKNQEQMREAAVAIEFDIFSFLVTELSDELVHSSPL